MKNKIIITLALSCALHLMPTAHAAPPTATTLPASGVSNSVALLLGRVNPGSVASTAWFEWGQLPPYRSQVSPLIAVGSGVSDVNLTNAISITPGLLYRGQVVISNTSYTVRGLPVAFGSPGITLNGAATLTNVINTPYSEAGATAEDFVLGVFGATYNLALRANGTVAAWGDNTYGQTTVPAGLTNVMAIGGGYFNPLAVRSNGTVVAWGAGTNSSGTSFNSGQSIVPTSATNVMAVAGGFTYSLALRTNGTVVGWGDNTAGQTTIPASATNVTAIAGGFNTAFALRGDGKLVAWGNNTYGQTTFPNSGSATNLMALSVNPGSYGSLALRSNNTVVAWGYGPITNVPAGLSNVVGIAGGASHGLALKSDGTVAAWGDNTYGQINVPAGLTQVIQVGAGANHSLALLRDGSVVAWGINDSGQTNVPAAVNTSLPVTVTGSVTPNMPGSYVLTYKTTNAFGAVGSLSRTVVVRPLVQAVVTLNGPATVTNECHSPYTDLGAFSGPSALAAGLYHNLALRSDGTVAAWGDNVRGQTDIPAGLSNVVAIAGGWYHSLALRRDGTVAAWGYNRYGQTDIPAGLSNVVALASGDSHSLALRSDGTVAAWGRNVEGQTTLPAGVSLPVAVSGSVDTNTLGSYVLTYSATNSLGGSGSVTRTVVVQDTLPPVITLLGTSPLTHFLNAPFLDPGATALDVCGGSFAILTHSTVTVAQVGTYTVTYRSTDSSGNAATYSRTVVVAESPSISSLTATLAATNGVNGNRTVRLAALVSAGGLDTTVNFQYGLTPAYGGTQSVRLPAGFTGSNVTSSVDLSAGVTYHWRVVAANGAGTTSSPDQTFNLFGTLDGGGIPGDLNGDGVVSQSELDAVYANYATNSARLYMANVAGLGGTNVTFALSNSVSGVYSVQYSTNLVDWLPLGPATPRYLFIDTNAPSLPQRYYRLSYP